MADNATGADLKAKIFASNGAPPEMQNLAYAGTYLRDDTSLVAQGILGPDNKITLVLNMRGD